MKKLLLAAFLLALAIPALADNDHNDGNGNDDCVHSGNCSDTGPQGPKGDKGDKGDKGNTGPQGPKGDKGSQGTDGQDGRDLNAETAVGVEAVLRLYDGKHTTLELFDAYDIRARRNHFAGLRFTFKLGKSYEQKERERLEKLLVSMQADIVKMRHYAHHPYVGQHLIYDDAAHTDAEPVHTKAKTNGGTLKP